MVQLFFRLSAFCFLSLCIPVVVGYNISSWGCSVGYLDIREFLSSEELARENHTEVKISNCDDDYKDIPLEIQDRNGMFVLTGKPFDGGRRSFGQHGQSPLIKRILEVSGTPNWKESDLVFVYDYCLKFPLSLRQTEIGVNLTKTAYDKLMQTDEWNRQLGRNFIFFLSHPGEIYNDRYRCNRMKHALHGFIEEGQACGQLLPHNLIVPYQTNHIIKEDKPFANRTKLLCFRGGINKQGTWGKRLRYWATKFFYSIAEDISVNNAVKDELTHEDLMKEYQNCKYCLVLAGDTPSSRRLVEVIAGGCIPVFIGPPFHQIFFKQYINWHSVGIFLYIKNQPWSVPFGTDEKAYNGYTIAPPYMQQLTNLFELPDFLRKLSHEKAEEKHNSVLKYQSLVEYLPNPHGYPSAIDTMMKHFCKVYQSDWSIVDENLEV